MDAVVEYKQLGKTDTRVPAIGQGTMGVGGYFTEDTTKDDFYINMLKLGIERGMTLIDTAEAYGAGHSEELVGRAVKDCRKDVFIATKVSPEHLAYESVLQSAEGSLRRLETDYIDLYQIHWPNPTVPLEETLRAMEKLVKDGKVRYIGVSNFSLKQLKLANRMFRHGIASIQIEYNLFDRTAEVDIFPYCEQEGISILAYSPLDQGRVPSGSNKTEVMRQIAKKYNKTTTQIALNWLVSKPSVIAVPKATSTNHIKENASATDFNLSEDDVKLISRTFTQPIISIPTDRIKVDRNGLAQFVPSPEELARDIQNGETLKPIRVVKSKDTSGKYDYDLVEGKVRYWAWVIAHDGKVPIRALVR